MSTLITQDTIYALAQSTHGLYAARASGLYRSQDGGATWHNLFTSLDAETLACTAVVCAGDTVFAGVKGAVLRSSDGGQTWHTAALAAPPPLVVTLVVSPHVADDGFIAAGTAQDGVFISQDGGATWTPWNFGLLDLTIYALALSPDFGRDQTLFVGTESGMFCSRSAGRTWDEMPFPMDAAPVLSLCVLSPDRLLAGTEAHGLFVSADGGAHWQPVLRDDLHGAINGLSATDAQTLWLLLDTALLASHDDGATWQPVAGAALTDRLAMALLPDAPTVGTVLVGCADGDLLTLPSS